MINEKLWKLIFYLCVLAFIVYIILYVVLYIKEKRVKTLLEWIEENDQLAERYIPVPADTYKYILQWTPGKQSPFHFMGKGQSAFIKNNCTYTNCYVTDYRTLLLDYRLFDAVVFNGYEIRNMPVSELPKLRTHQQKYIFGVMESADYYPICKPYFDNYFNWTWTYRLDSDVRWGYITFYHLNGTKAGPKEEMDWPDHFEPITDELKVKLNNKTKTAAWFVSNCKTRSKREAMVMEIQKELNTTYGLEVDIYGSCGKLRCPRNKSKECWDMLQRDYYFYFSFENSFAQDYVTEKVLTALNYLALPVVYGIANYDRFLPPGSYINAEKLGAKETARTMDYLIRNKTAYYEYFNWRNHYTYKETSENEDICNLCALLNDKEKFNSFSVYKEFRKWWNPNGNINYCKS